MPDLPRFKLGDMVTWAGRANGRRKCHVGDIVVVVPVGERPSEHYCFSHNTSHILMFDDVIRNHESYIVRDNATLWLYRPRVKALEAVR